MSPACRIAHSFIEFRNTLPSPGAPTNTGIAIFEHVASSPERDSVPLFLSRIELAETVPEFGPRHLLLELGKDRTALRNLSWSSSTSSSNAISVTRMVRSSRKAASSPKIGTSWMHSWRSSSDRCPS